MMADTYIYPEEVIWYQTRTWGGTQAVPAIFIKQAGKTSARIKVNDKFRTVRLSSIRKAERVEREL
jgi:hypothetical protein